MKRVARSAMCALMTMMLACAVLGSKDASFTVRAEELNNDPMMSTQGTDSDFENEDTLDVCFYIRGDAIGADIPSEPALHLGEVYSDPIRIDGAVSSDFSSSTHEVDGQEDDLLSDGFTASNEVSTMLRRLPEAGDIADVIDGFDESRHYVVWYVIKTSPFSYPYSDVYVHVDGVIRERTAVTDSDNEEDPAVTEPNDPVFTEPSDPIVTEPTDPVESTNPTGQEGTTGPSEQSGEMGSGSQAGTSGHTGPSGQTEPVSQAGSNGSTNPQTNVTPITDGTSTNLPSTNQTTTDIPSTQESTNSGVADSSRNDNRTPAGTKLPSGDNRNSATDTATPATEAISSENTELTEAEAVISEVTLEVRALFLENGVECREIEYDGSEHIIGGFEIVIHDKESGNPLIGYLYECYGQFIGFRSYADNGAGTEFTYKGQQFWINVVKAFAKVVNPGDSQEVIFYDADDRPLREAADFIIKDQAGKVLPARFNVVPNTDTVTVRRRDITIEAGTSVRNDSGETLTDDSFTISEGSLMDGHRIERVVINGSQTGAGRSLNEISDITIVDENGNEVNDQYNIETVDGELILVDATGNTSVQSAEMSDTAREIQIIKGNNTIVIDNTGIQPVVLSTENVIMESADSAGESTAKSKVLGARRSETGDQNSDLHVRILLLTACFASALAMHKFNHN